MNNVEKAPQAPIDFERTTDIATGIALSLAGSALAGVGIVGMDSHEAKVDTDAFMSVPVGERDNFITTADLPYMGSFGVGVALAAVGIYKLFGRRHSATTSKQRSVSPDNQDHVFHKVHQPHNN